MLAMVNARSSSPPPRPKPHRRTQDRVLPPPRVVLIEIVRVAAVLGWTRKRTLRWLQKEGAVSRYGRHWYVTRGQLRRAFPTMWDEVAAAAAEVDRDDD